MSKKLLVTGGAGFIGSNFVIDRVKDGDFVLNLDKLTYAGNLKNLIEIEKSPNYVFAQGGIEDPELVSKLLRKHKIDSVVNFAAESHVDRSISGPGEFIFTNVVGTFRLLDTVLGYFKELDSDLKSAFRFLHVSTDEVYGTLSPNDPAFSETTQYAPNSPYSASKASSDHLVRAYLHTYGLPVLTTNCSNNYGPFQFPEKLIPLIIFNAVNGKALPIYGDGKNVRDWLYVGDHCSAIDTVLKRGRVGETYNVGGESEIANIDVVQTICSILDELHPGGAPHNKLITYVKDRPGHDRRYAINCEKLKSELGWKQSETFESGIRKTVKWYLDHIAWVDDIASGAYRNWIEKNYTGR
jgi:dTDP-glucose 4,6-dehydratase